MIPRPDGVDAFVPRRLPESYPRKRLKLRIISGWHQVAHFDDPNLFDRNFEIK